MMNYELLITDGERVFSPVVTDGVVWNTARKGAAGKLTFSILRDKAMIPAEGARVTFSAGGRQVFCGYIFRGAGTRRG